jgi:putative radical SAM enzyme (TIGR03279 family)
MLRILRVRPDSPAARLGLRAGDALLRINGEPVRDLIDWRFLVADEDLRLEVARDGRPETLEAHWPQGTDPGLEFAPEKIRLCSNACVFCFVDQNPRGLRPSLYVKDEDYRLSFLHGNFVTLTNLKNWELQRIVRQRLSPLYVSVHSTDPETRRRLLRPRRDRDLLETMRYLIRHGIELHAQIVLCPGYNDGEDLVRTLGDLWELRPGVASVAVVPLGMTRHREGLVPLEPVTPSVAREVAAIVEPLQERSRRETGRTWVYLADEFYRLLRRRVPPAPAYDDFPQLENGIGMTRRFLETLKGMPDLFGAARARGERRFAVATGRLFAPILRRALKRHLERTGEAAEVSVRVVAVPNRFFGESVTVAGLLTGGDILRAVAGLARQGRLGDRLYLPPACVNEDGVFLDDRRPEELASELGVPVSPAFFDPRTRPAAAASGGS